MNTTTAAPPVPELFAKAADCCGCTACASICPHQAIIMVSDAEGFLYPSIVTEKCVRCGLCLTVCAFKLDLYALGENA